MSTELIRLREWLRKNGKADGDFARELDCSPGYFSLVLQGKKFAGRDLASRIQEKTGIDARYVLHIPIVPDRGDL